MCVKTNKTKKKVTEIMSCMSDFFSSFVTSVMANLAAGSSAWKIASLAFDKRDPLENKLLATSSEKI